MDKCFFCEREMDINWARCFFDPNWIPGTPKTQDWSKIKSCCMGCEGKVKNYMMERETKQAVNKDGKLLFRVEDGETWWYLGDSEEQVIEYHKSLMDDEVDIDKCEPITILKALKTEVHTDDIGEDGKDIYIKMSDAINEKMVYDNGCFLVSSSVY